MSGSGHQHKYYYFYISRTRERHRFYTSMWGMVVPLGSWRHRGNDRFEDGERLLRTAVSGRGFCELAFRRLNRLLPGRDLIAVADEPR
jgi:hypothetical protein